MPSDAHKLYYSLICPFAQRAMIVAKHKNMPGEFIHIDLDKELPEWYTKDINPREEVPALTLPNGMNLSESMPIALYLDEALEPKNSLFSPDAEIRRRIRQFASDFEPAMWSLYSALSSKPEELESKVASCRRELQRFVPRMSTSSDFAIGSTFSMADVLICPFIIRFAHLCPIFCGFDLVGEFPRLRAFRDQCLSVPAVATTSPSAEVCIYGYGIGYAKDKKPEWKYRLKAGHNCPFSERVELVWSYINNGPRGSSFIKGKETQYMEITRVADLSKEENVPTLTLPNGAAITTSVDAATYLAEQFPCCGLLPESAADVYAGRWFAHACGMVIDDLIAFIMAHRKGFEISDPVVVELQRADKIFSDASGKKGPFMFGSDPSLYDLLVIPFFHRAEFLIGDKLGQLAPAIAAAVKAARACPILSKKLVSESEFFASKQ